MAFHYECCLLFCVALVTRKPIQWHALRKNALPLLIAGSCLGINGAFIFAAYNATTVSMATIVFYCAPVIVFFLSPIVFKVRLTKRQIIGIGAAVLGMLLVNLSAFQTGALSWGTLYAFIAAVLYAVVAIANRFVRDVPDLDSTFAQMSIAAVIMILYCTATTGQFLQVFDPISMFYTAILGCLHTAIGYMLYFSCLQSIPPQEVAVLSYIDPATALLFSFIFLGELLTPLQIFGVVLIFGGTIFAQFVSHRPASHNGLPARFNRGKPADILPETPVESTSE